MSYFSQLRLFLVKNPFLKDSSLVFIANISNSLLNYGLVLLVGHLLLKEEFVQWVIIGGLITLLASFSNGMVVHYVKRVSSLEHKQKGLSLKYREYIQKWLFKALLIIFLTSPLTTLLIQKLILPNQPYLLIFLAINQVFISFSGGLGQNFLLGILAVKEFAVGSLLSNVFRLITTVVLIFAGFGAFALPLGMLSSVIVIFLVSDYFIKKKFKNQKIPLILDENLPTFNIKQEIVGSQATALILFTLVAFFTLSNFFVDRFLEPTDKDIFAVIYSFGQMLHFGPVAFLSALIPHSAKSKGKKIILQATGVTILLTVGGILTLMLFGNVFLWLIGRSDYQEFLPLVWFYGFFILGYNVIYVATQFLIAKASFRKVLILPILMFFYIIIMTLIVNKIIVFKNFEILDIFIYVNVLFGLVGGVLMLFQSLKKA